MSFRGGNRRFFHGHPKGDRYRNEHDDRGNSEGNHVRNNMRNFNVFKGNDRSRRMPDGHWRGEKDRRGGGNFRGQRGGRHHFVGDDEGGHRGGNRREAMYKARGHRKGNRDKQQNNVINPSGWNKIIIRDSSPLDKEEVLGAIRRVVQLQFIPVMYEPEGNNRVFYIEDNPAAVQAILDISRRVTMASGQKLIIFSNRSPPPVRALTPEQREAVTVVMSERYCVELKRLDLKNFHNDQNLVKADIFCPIYRIPNMKAVVEVITNHIPLVEEIDFSSNKLFSLEGTHQLVTKCQNLKRLNFSNNKLPNIDVLGFLEGLNVVDLTLEGNILCNKFRDTESYIRQVPQMFFLNPD